MSIERSRRRRLRWVYVLAVLAILVAALVLWFKSPVELLSGPHGRLSSVGRGVPPGPARYHLKATGPVVVEGAALSLDGSGVRAINLRDRSTYWELSRPGAVTAQSLWPLDGSHAAVMWSDGRLTVIDVPAGKHWDRNPGAPHPPVAVDEMGAADGEPALVVVIYPTRVEAFALRSGNPLWSYTAPSNQAVSDAELTGEFLLLNLSTYSVVLNNHGRPRLRLTTPSNYSGPDITAVGGGRVAQPLFVEAGYAVYGGADLRRLYVLPGSENITGGRGVIVTWGTGGPVSAYDSSDGRLLWQRYYTAPGPGPLGQQVVSVAVYGGQVRILQFWSPVTGSCPWTYRLISLSPSGAVTGIKPLSVFNCRSIAFTPRLVDGRDGVLVVANNESIVIGRHDQYYLYVG